MKGFISSFFVFETKQEKIVLIFNCKNLSFIENYDPEHVLILSGDHIYKMDYEVMLDYHKANNADVTIAAMPVPIEEASRFGVVVTDENHKITEFQEKPEHPKSNLASMGIYIFSWPVLRDALIKLKDQPNCDFGMHVIPYVHENGKRIFAYEYTGYWKDVGTLKSYWQANMELIDIVPEFNLYEEFWKIYTKSEALPPQYVSADSKIERSIICNGCEVRGNVHNSVISANVDIAEDAEVHDSIIMQGCKIGKGTKIYNAIVAENTIIGDNCSIGVGEYADSKLSQKIYNCELAVIGENSTIPSGVTLGKNVAVSGKTELSDYPDGKLSSGDYIVKAGEI